MPRESTVETQTIHKGEKRAKNSIFQAICLGDTVTLFKDNTKILGIGRDTDNRRVTDSGDNSELTYLAQALTSVI